MQIAPVGDFLGLARGALRQANLLSPAVAARNVNAGIENALQYVDVEPEHRHLANEASKAAQSFSDLLARNGLFNPNAPEIGEARERALAAIDHLETALETAKVSGFGSSMGY